MLDRTGQTLGQYRIIASIGRGGFADVYLGEHIFLKTQAAIKVLLDGKAYIDLEDAHIAGSGTVGVWTKADSVTAFDDFTYSATTP